MRAGSHRRAPEWCAKTATFDEIMDDTDSSAYNIVL